MEFLFSRISKLDRFSCRDCFLNCFKNQNFSDLKIIEFFLPVKKVQDLEKYKGYSVNAKYAKKKTFYTNFMNV